MKKFTIVTKLFATITICVAFVDYIIYSTNNDEHCDPVFIGLFVLAIIYGIFTILFGIADIKNKN